MLTIEDFFGMATKEDIANMATKEDLVNFATKKDVAETPYIKTAVHELSTKVDIIEKEMVKKEDLVYIHQKLLNMTVKSLH